jgi:hypothetical protein
VTVVTAVLDGCGAGVAVDDGRGGGVPRGAGAGDAGDYKGRESGGGGDGHGRGEEFAVYVAGVV